MVRLTILLLLIVFRPFNLQRQNPFKGCAVEGLGKNTPKNPTGKLGEKMRVQNIRES
jgi:hypothetical protein